MDAKIILALIAFVFGLCFGSFLNVIVYRLPRKQSIAQPPSFCPECKTRLKIADLVPILSFILLKGRCRYCGAGIAVRYPLVELAAGLLFAALFYRFGLTIDTFFYLSLLYILMAITLIDFEHRIVPNTLVACGIVMAVLFFLPPLIAYLTDLPDLFLISIAPLDALAGAAAGGGVMLLIILVSRGGMGAGDMKLMLMIGLFVGLRGVAVVLMLSFIFGALVGIALMILGRATRKDALPFAPYLSLATFVNVFWGETIWNWYMNLMF
jgi:leader peptidase (prepilin peptidase) / N-methyltransferase